MKFLRSLFLLVGLAALPACATSEMRNEGKPVESAPLVTQVETPVAAPAVSPSAPPPRSFAVHFDFDSSDIRASAMQILYEASQVAGKVKPAAIRINGFTDASGNRAYNQKLSERRAKAVANQLLKLGVKVATVEIKGFGTSKSKGKSKDNRRVEIIFEGGDHAESFATPISSAITKASAAKSVFVASGPPTTSPLILASAHHVSPLVTLQTTGKHAIKRDRVRMMGHGMDPPASAVPTALNRMDGRAV